jgi:hypothetical protein
MNRFLLGPVVAIAAMTNVSAEVAVPPVQMRIAQAKPAADTPALKAFKAAIREKYALKERAFAAHDPEPILTRFYTSDVISAAAGDKVFVGREQLRPLYVEHVKDSKIKVESVYTFVNGDAGWDWADFHVTPDDPKQAPFTLAILFLWTQVNGEWMCKGDFFAPGSFRQGTMAPSQAESH